MKEIIKLVSNMEQIMIGKKSIIRRIVIALLVNGHVLIEDVPGVGKTQCVSALAKSIDGTFKRIQFTPDVMASDITGFTMYNPTTGNFEYKEGTAFCNFLLADEINRASSKTQSSLLEVMEERQITVDGITRVLPEPFMVLATQNPIESKGTNKLPEAQLDRFIFKLSIGYPSKEGEKEILNRFVGENPIKKLESVISSEEIVNMQKKVEEVLVSEEIKELIVSIVSNTRSSKELDLGVSPRGSIALLRVAKAIAFINGRDYVIPDDVVEMAKDVLSHRVIVSTSATIKGLRAKDIILNCVDRALKSTSKVM